MKNSTDLEKELVFLGLLDKAREIYFELGERAVLSYIKSSYRLLSKVYHPDLNPGNVAKAKMAQQSLNRASRLISKMKDEEIIELLKKGVTRQVSSKKKVLVVEDEQELQELFRDVFLMEGYDVRTAANGHNGYKVYRQFEPDIVVTDVVMPKMNGLELVKKIRKVNHRIKVVFISGFFGIRGLKRELDKEVLKYGYLTLSKPFKMSMMLDLVKEYLEAAPTESGGVNLFV